MKVLDPSDSLSLPSEPPDIGNWFSSYVYESPVLDSNDGFENTEFQKEGFHDEEISDENEENLCDFRKSGNENDEDDFKMRGNQSMVKDRQCLKQEKDLTVMYNLPFKTILERNGEEKVTQKHEYSSRQDIEKSYLAVDEDHVGNLLDMKTSEEPKFMPLQKEWSLLGEKIVKESVREKTAKASLGNGFISTRKNKSSKENDETSLKRPQGEILKIVKARSSIVKRKALSDIINIQSTDAALEIAGKWMCPEKSKPDLGPPMKQLRLEQWVFRRA